MSDRIVILGGSGLIGRKLADRLRQAGREVVQASPSTGVDAVTGQGLAEALNGAATVVDVTNAPSFDEETASAFFLSSTRNLQVEAAKAGISHYVALSVVGTERLTELGYFRAKLAQEALIEEGALPYSILRATQFFEFLGTIAGAAASAGELRVPDADFQPVAADDVAAALAKIAEARPLNRMVELGGPERGPFERFVAAYLRSEGDGRRVVADPGASYFGARLDKASLTPGADSLKGAITLRDWLQARPAAA